MEDIIKNLSIKSVDFVLQILIGLVLLIIGFRIINIIEKN